MTEQQDDQHPGDEAAPTARRQPARGFEVEQDYPQAGIRIVVNRRDNLVGILFDDDRPSTRDEKDRMETQAGLRWQTYRKQWEGNWGSFATRMATKRLAQEFNKERGGQGVGM